jgi:diguanylate cyclase (GGDEF)-like protein
MGPNFFKPREPARVARIFFAVYAGLGLVLSAAVGGHLVFPGDWIWALAAGIIAWGALQQGLTVLVEGWILSPEVGVYLFVFLVYGFWPAFMAVLVTSLLSLAHGLAVKPSNRHVDFCLRKLANIFVLEVALLAAAFLYRQAGGSQPMERLGAHEGIGLVLFWLAFTLVNNWLFWPVDISREGAFRFRRLLKETGIDGAVHALGVLSGAGFAILYNHLGMGPLLMLLPVYALLVVFLKRVTEQEHRLTLQQALLRKLNEKGAQLHGSLDLGVVLDAVGEVVQELFRGDVYFVALFDERTGKIQVARAVDRGEPLAIGDFDPDQGLTGWVMRTGEPLFSDDITSDARLRSLMKPVGDDANPVRSVMLGPLTDKGRIIGVFSVQSNSADAFKPFHRELFLAVLQQVATATVAARLYRRATEDGLTRLFNKSYLDERVQSCLEAHAAFGLIFIDCDDFKSINDRHGHPLGDRYLAALAGEIHHLCRSGDVPSRCGGDEFAVLLPSATAEQSRKVAERILVAVDGLSLLVGGEGIGTTVSMGVLWSDGSCGPIPVEDVFQKVDLALYEAKRAKHAIVESVL